MAPEIDRELLNYQAGTGEIRSNRAFFSSLLMFTKLFFAV
jgi:hypothetical protein